MDISQQAGKYIFNVEYNHGSRVDHLQTGIALIREFHYAEACRELTRAIEERPGVNQGHYYLALALLRGCRPNRCRQSVLDRVRMHLRAASSVPEARVLLVMVDEDDRLRWRYHSEIPQALFDLIGLVARDRIAELLAHVPAEGARTHRVLEMALARNESD